MLKIKEIEEKLKELNEEVANWSFMTPGGWGYILVNDDGTIENYVLSQNNTVSFNYDVYKIEAPATLDQVLKALDHWGIKYE